MTKTHKLIIIVTIIVFLLTLMFPICYPRTSPPDESRFRRTIDAGHRGFHFLLDIPASKAIDVRALLLSWILLASLAGIAYYMARPNSEIRRLVRNRAFRLAVFWLCVSSVLVVVITVTSVAVENLYLQPQREAKEAAERAALLQEKSHELDELLHWSPNDTPVELERKRTKSDFTKAIEELVPERTDPNYCLSSLTSICMGSTSSKTNEVGSKLHMAKLHGYSAEQILAAFCKAYPGDANSYEFQEYKNINTTLTLDDMAARWKPGFLR